MVVVEVLAELKSAVRYDEIKRFTLCKKTCLVQVFLLGLKI